MAWQLPSGRRNAPFSSSSAMEEDSSLCWCTNTALLHPTTLHYTAGMNCVCSDQHQTAPPLLTTDGKSAKTVFPQKHTATKWAQPRLPYVCVHRTWQYRHRTGKDIKHVLYVPAMPYVHCSVHSTAVHGLDIKHRKTENSQRKFHGGPHLSLGLHVISKLCHICWKPPFKPTNICEENAT